MCASVPKIVAFEPLGIVQQNSDDKRFSVDIQEEQIPCEKPQFSDKGGGLGTDQARLRQMNTAQLSAGIAV